MSDAIYAAAREKLIREMTNEALAELTGDNLRVALTAAVPGRMPDQLRDYWTRGEGAAKIRWGTDGSFDRCVRLLRKYFPNDPKGLCARLHKRATGEWPAEKGIESSAGWGAPSETETAFHLPGRHNQQAHGNRVGRTGNVPGKTGIGGTVRRDLEVKGRREIAEEPEHLEGLRTSIRDAEKKQARVNRAQEQGDRRRRDLEESQRRRAGRLALAELTPKGREGLRRVGEIVGDSEGAVVPTPRSGGVNENTLWNMEKKGFIRRAWVRDSDGTMVQQTTLTDKGRAALAELRADTSANTRARTADAGRSPDMAADELTAHAGPETAEDIDSMDAALAYLDEPDDFVDSIMPTYTAWSGMLAPIGKPTGDRRIFEPGALSNRDLPLPLMWQEKTDDGHLKSSVVGTIEALEHREDGTYGSGRFLSPELFPDAEKAMALMRARVNGPSVDLDDVTYSMKNVDGTPFDVAAYEAAALGGQEPAKPLLSVSQGRISGATLVSIPAFAEVAHTWVLEDRADEDAFSAALAADMDDCEDCLTASADALAAAAGYANPPLAAFLPRELPGPTGLTIDGDAVYGHIATWGTCHVGYPDTCVTPPTSKSAYAFFHTGEVTTAEGERIAVGRLVLGAPHADLAKGFRAAAQHYDDTGRVVALVRAYEDAHGIAFSGVLVRDLDEETRAQFAAMPLSGDWRRVGGAMEMVAAISVPVPGFPVVRASGNKQTALVAAGVLHSANTQPVDEPAPVRAEIIGMTRGADGTMTLTFRGLDEMRLTNDTLESVQAAEASGPEAEFAAQLDAELAALDATIGRESLALLKGLTLGE